MTTAPDTDRAAQARAVLACAEVFVRLGVARPWLFTCPDCGTPGLLEERENAACCGYCGKGPWAPLDAAMDAAMIELAAEHGQPAGFEEGHR